MKQRKHCKKDQTLLTEPNDLPQKKKGTFFFSLSGKRKQVLTWNVNIMVLTSDTDQKKIGDEYFIKKQPKILIIIKFSTICDNYIYCMADGFHILWLVNSRSVKKPYRPQALYHLSKRQIILFVSWNNQQSHIINILFIMVALFDRSVGQVYGSSFFPSLFSWPVHFALGP